MFKSNIFRKVLALIAFTVCAFAITWLKPHTTTASTPPLPGVRFVHIANSNNTFSNQTVIDHPLLNNNPNAIFLVTQNYNPGGVGGTYNSKEIGVFYSLNRWRIFNQSYTSTMPLGAGFNVFVPDPGAHVFVHKAITSNIYSNSTCISHPLLNNKPNAKVLVTQNYNPGGIGGVYNDHPIGVFYDGNIYCISNYDGAAMPLNASFNVVVADPASTAFIHTATTSNSSGVTTAIDHPLLNGNPNAIVLVSQNFNPDGSPGIYNPHPIGVYYASGRWRIFNQNIITMPLGANFNILVPDTRADVLVHTRAEVSVGNDTLINHPLLNNNPNAIFLITQNWNPNNRVFGVNNDRSISAWYDSTTNRWGIFNYGGTMATDTSFNVLIPPPGANLFVHRAITGTGGNIGCSSNHCTYIDHPLLNYRPHAIFLVTQNWNPGGGTGVNHGNHAIGVWYDTAQYKWVIFNQDFAVMENNASFNVMVLNDLTALPWSKAAFTHTAEIGNTMANWTALDHPLSNGIPPAFVFATDRLVTVYNNNKTGVWYTGSPSSIPNRWAIFNQNTAASMPSGAQFNVLVISRQVSVPIVRK